MLRSIIAAAAILLATGASFAIPAPPPAAPPATAPAANKMSFTGKLSTGVMAIGGETTGTIISDGKTTYELDIKGAALKTKAEGLNGKQVTVTGTLTIKAGVEIAQRRIITVDTLEAAVSASAPAAPAAAVPTPH